MQLRSRLLCGLVVTMLVLAMAPTSNAQINITVFENGSTLENNFNRHAMTADRSSVGAGMVVSGSLLASSPLTTTTLTITYPGDITSSVALPAGDALRVEGRSGIFATVAISTVLYSSNQVLLQLPGFGAGVQNTSGSFRLIGVRMDATGLTAPATTTYSLSNTANNYLLSDTSGTVVTAFGNGITSMAIGAITGGTSTGTSTIFSNATPTTTTASLVITEGFASAWRTASQESGSGVGLTGNGTSVEVTFTGIPTGVTVGVVGTGSSTLTGLTITDASLTTASGDNDVTVRFTGSSLTAIEQIQLSLTFTVSGTTTAIAIGSITAIADLEPLGTGLTGAVPTATGGIPRFSTNATPAVTVSSIVSATTNMLIPFVVNDGLAGGFNTGVSVANTTSDPYTIGGATAASGALTFTFYPRKADGADTSWTLTTSTSVRPGVGLSADGTLASGGTWSGLLSELMAAGNKTGAFTGYIFIRADFLLAHGTSFVTNFSTFTSASPVLILGPTETTPRNGSALESLGL